mmetsp:Transcript_22197/g.24666  ORF Transcript_22197/g.24666 Transcript_22197/m.24666 type:complete len:254 (+) Transcript_22197:123-884(+)
MSKLADYSKVRILVLGDSGVGKTSFVHKLCLDRVLRDPTWTVGCETEVKLHEHQRTGRTFFVEFWDVGGHRKYKHGRDVFYHQINGIVLTYDLMNRKSYQNLRGWIRELVEVDKRSALEEKHTFHELGQSRSSDQDRLDSTNGHVSVPAPVASLPIIVVGNKLDLQANPRTYECMKDFGLETVCVSSVAEDDLSGKLGPFFDRVIDHRYYRADTRAGGQSRTSARRMPPSGLRRSLPRYGCDLSLTRAAPLGP